MAAENPMESLQDEASCPICLEYFQDPVIIDCGHNFCRGCISRCWEGSDSEVSCPQCRETAQQRNLRPNRQLANVVEIAKKLSFQAGTGSGGDSVCDEHQEPLKLFCEEDQTPICVVCDRSQAHRAHAVVPIEEAAQEYKEKIQAHLEILKEEREKLLRFKVTGEGKSLEYLIQTQNKRQKVVSEFQQLWQFLEEEEQLLMAQLENLEKAIVKIQNDNVIKMSEEISRLSNLISDLEGKCQKPASEFLRDVRSTLSRCEKGKFLQPVEISPELEKRLSDFSQQNIALMEILWKFKDILPSELETIRGKSLGSHRPEFSALGETRLPILTASSVHHHGGETSTTTVGGAGRGTSRPVMCGHLGHHQEEINKEVLPLSEVTNGVPPFGVRMEHKGKEVDGVEHKHVQMFSGTGTEVDQPDVLQPIQDSFPPELEQGREDLWDHTSRNECDSGSRHGSSPTHPV
ncbi:unnamed protein product [Lepidochelys olivacea]